MNNLNGLFYPFSRLSNPSVLKHFLLVFDSVTFIDEAGKEKWRNILAPKMADVNQSFESLAKLTDDYDNLTEAKAIEILDPATLRASKSRDVAISTIADLSDKEFVKLASRPDQFGLPTIPWNKFGIPIQSPSWEIFQNKIALPLIIDKNLAKNKKWATNVLHNADELRYLISENDSLLNFLNQSELAPWILTYQGGSAATINFYLEAASELGLTLITTSTLHHQLVLRKLKRAFTIHSEEKNIGLLDDLDRKRFRAIIAHGELVRLLDNLFPPSQLDGISFTKILKFRKETQELREKFSREIDNISRVIDSDPSTIKYESEIAKAFQALKQETVYFESQIASLRDKIFPSLAKATLFGAAGSGALGTLMSFLGGLTPHGLVVTSAITISASFLVEAMDIWKTKRELIRSQKSSVLYLSKLGELTK